MTLSNNVPDPSFPPVPVAIPGQTQTLATPPTLPNLGATEPLVEQPVTLEDVDHMTTVVEGGDALVETPSAPGTPLSDQKLTEKSAGADYS